MKICACVAEYNPFHLGHVRHIRYMKEDLGFDRVIAVMSGNFTQRGEPPRRTSSPARNGPFSAAPTS